MNSKQWFSASLARLLQAAKKTTVTRITSCYSANVCRRAYLNPQLPAGYHTMYKAHTRQKEVQPSTSKVFLIVDHNCLL